VPQRSGTSGRAQISRVPGRGAARLAVLVLSVVLAAGGPAWARRQKTVFHGLPTEPAEAVRPGAAAEPITLSPIWTFDGFAAPLAGDPVALGTGLVASDRAGRLAALDAGGPGTTWSVDLGGPLSVGPVAANGMILQATATGDLVALDAHDGHTLWRAALGGAPVAPPALAAGSLLLATDAPELIAVRPDDGRVLARLPLPGRPVAPEIAGEVAVVGTDHGMLLALDVPTLRVRWRRYLRHAVTAPPLVHDKRIYVAVADRSLRCLRLRSGRPRWRQRTGSITGARLLVRDERLYVQCYDNDIYVLKAGSGHLVGRVRLDHRLSLDGGVTPDHLFVAPFTEGTVLGLAFPYLGMAGHFRLEAQGEWFTTRPVIVANDRLAVGYGRNAGRILFLSVQPGPPPDKAADAPASPPTR
jgi:outer membrane protein assembly factor BamB